MALVAATTGCGRDTDPGTATPPTESPSPTGNGAEPTASPQAFQSRIKRVTARDLPHSWRRGCPVGPSALRMIEMTYWGMDDKPHTNGRLVVNARYADELVTVFKKLYDMRYPINRMEPIDRFKGSDFDSIEANNTSAFNCRRATGSSNWSQHALGLALDINPCENPYVSSSGEVAHEDCVKFKDRDRDDPGVIHAGDEVVQAFESIGWGWGGEWSGARDYQHFSSSGR
jgi:hypothetical protein